MLIHPMVSETELMRRIALIGAGPTGLYTLATLIHGDAPLCITLFEQGDQAGVGMPYDEHANHRAMLANIASIEIPPLTRSYLEWLRAQSSGFLADYGVDKTGLHERQFLPRVLLGHYFRGQCLALVRAGRHRGHRITVEERCRVVDLAADADGLRLWTDRHRAPLAFDRAVIATGHVWPSPASGNRAYFPSPWTGLIDADLPAAEVGVLGTSLSGIDAALAVAVQHGHFEEQPDHPEHSLRFRVNAGSEGLRITLMSRTGLLPEADFYCPIPHEPLQVATEARLDREIEAGAEGLLDRAFDLMVQELRRQDPAWSARLGLEEQNADTFAGAYFEERARRNPFHWARHNLEEVERNKRARHTVPWRYALLRLHEVMEPIAPHLTEADRQRFDAGLRKVFVDNYATVPPESIRRLLALRAAGVLDLRALGQDYRMDVGEDSTRLCTDQGEYRFAVVINARGQKPKDLTDLPLPTLRRQLLDQGGPLPPLAEDYSLRVPAIGGHRIALAALPFLMHHRPFVQGIEACAEIGRAVGRSVIEAPLVQHPL